MIQSVNPAPTDETDGLPMPRRIWAVISVGFALCMSVLDVNIINIVLPTLSHDFGTSPAVTTWIINGYQLAIVVSLLSFSALGEIIGYRKVYLSGIGLFCITSLICALSDSFWTLTIARIFQGFSASAITSVNTAQLRYIYPKSQLGRGMGINAMVVAISAAARTFRSQRDSFHCQLALAVRDKRTLGNYGISAGYEAFTETRRTHETKVRYDQCHSQCYYFRITDLHAGRIRTSRKNGFSFHPINCSRGGGYLLRAPSTQPNHSVTTLGPITYPYFPTVYPDLHLFVYRANVGNGFFTLFPAKHLGTQ